MHSLCTHDCPDTCRLRVQVNGSVPAGVVACRLAWNRSLADGRGVNVLTSEAVADFGGGATFYSTLVEVRRAGELTPG